LEDIESFFEVMIVFIAVIGGVISTIKKSQRNRVHDAAQQSAAQARVKAAQQQIQRQTQPKAARRDAYRQVMTPTVHTHVQPDCDTHDAPGSLGYTSTEGKDPCHEEQLTHLRTPEETAVPEQDGLTFNWSGSDLVKAVVMQEVLTRPANRAPAYPRRGQ